MFGTGSRQLIVRRFAYLESVFRDRRAVVSPLRPGGLFFEVLSVYLDTLAIHIGRTSPLLVQGVVPKDRLCVVLPLGAPKSVRLNGVDLGPRMVTTHGPGATVMSANHADTDICWITVGMTALDRIFAPRAARRVLAGESATVLTDGEAWDRSVSVVRAVADVVRTDPAIFDVEEARRSLRASVLEMLSDLLEGPPNRKPARRVRGSPGRQRLMWAAHEHLRAQAAGGVTPSSLAEALGVTAAKLEAACRATFGIELARYLHIRRLLALREAGGAADADCRRGMVDPVVRDYEDLFAEPLVAGNPGSGPAGSGVDPSSM